MNYFKLFLHRIFEIFMNNVLFKHTDYIFRNIYINTLTAIEYSYKLPAGIRELG